MYNLVENIKNVLKHCEENHHRKALKTSSAKAQIATQYLLAVGYSLKSVIDPELLENNYISISYGSGYFPKVPWVAIVPDGKKVSNSISVTLCFGSYGEGVVIGAMFPKRVKEGLFRTTTRGDDNDFKINISGKNSATLYSNKFINPFDLEKNDISEAILIKHVQDSILLMNDYLKYRDS